MPRLKVDPVSIHPFHMKIFKPQWFIRLTDLCENILESLNHINDVERGEQERKRKMQIGEWG